MLKTGIMQDIGEKSEGWKANYSVFHIWKCSSPEEQLFSLKKVRCCSKKNAVSLPYSTSNCSLSMILSLFGAASARY